MGLGLAFGAVLITGLYAIYALGVKVGKMESDAEWAQKNADYFEGKLDEALGMLSEQIKRTRFEKAEKELFPDVSPYSPPVQPQPYIHPLAGDTITWQTNDAVEYDGHVWTVDGRSVELDISRPSSGHSFSYMDKLGEDDGD